MISFEQGSHFNFFIELHSSVRLTGLLLLLICLTLFGGALGTLFIREDSSFPSTVRVGGPNVMAALLVFHKESFTLPSSF